LSNSWGSGVLLHIERSKEERGKDPVLSPIHTKKGKEGGQDCHVLFYLVGGFNYNEGGKMMISVKKKKKKKKKRTVGR